MHTYFELRFWPAAWLAIAGLSISALPAVAQTATPPKPGMHRAEKHESRHEIDQLEEDWRQAALKGNTASMESLLADDYIAITANGTLQTKDQMLADLRDGQTHFKTLDLSERKVRFYGTTAVVTSIAQVSGVTPEGDLSGSYRYTRVYVRELGGKWKVVSFEASPVREPGEHR